MATAILSLEQAAELVGRMNAAAEDRGRFSEIVMPNEKKLADGYVARIAEALQCMGMVMPESYSLPAE